VVKIADQLARRGVLVPYRTLHRFSTEQCGFGRGGRTPMRVADGSRAGVPDRLHPDGPGL
jgi:hypothetical protein